MPLTSTMLRRSARAWISWDLEPRGPVWLQWVWTLLFAAFIGFGFTLLGMAIYGSRDPSRWLELGAWGRTYRVNFTIALTISVLIHLLFDIAIRRTGPARIRRMSHRQRALFFLSIPMAGVLIGWPLGLWLVGQGGAQWVHIRNPAEFFSGTFVALLISFIIFLFFNARAKQALAEKRATEAQLRLLQGQMEPHFLFNTLANVQTLIEHDPPKARQMLESFTDYLRSSLGTLRREHSTVGAELDLAQAYLTLLQTRMEDRLRFEIVCAADVRESRLPPLLIQPLVENAIQHGLEPKVEGGTLHIDARRDGDVLVLTVRDDGLGRDAPARPGRRVGNGVALDNLRQRLNTAHGPVASLTLSDAHPGTVATLRLPIDTAPRESP